jgi:hypothetical protein
VIDSTTAQIIWTYKTPRHGLRLNEFPMAGVSVGSPLIPSLFIYFFRKIGD